MKYEVTWITYEYDFDSEMDIECFTTEQFNGLDEAIVNYNKLRANEEVYYVKISVILDEFDRNAQIIQKLERISGDKM